MLETDSDGFIWQNGPTHARVWAVAWLSSDPAFEDGDLMEPLPQVSTYLVGHGVKSCPRNWVLS